ncbi:MAG: response regulator [Candidatus Poribacteria bacterium]
MRQPNYTVLLVDDDINSLSIMVEIMRRDGYDTICAINGHDAIRKIQDNPVDIVILDFHLPDTTGLDVLEQIKHIQPNVPVIITSADSSPGILLDVHDAGAYSFIRKPANLNRLRQTVSKALSIRERQSTRTTIQIKQQSSVLWKRARTIGLYRWSRKIMWWRETRIESTHVENLSRREIPQRGTDKVGEDTYKEDENE